MAPLPTLTLARQIVRNYRNDDFSLIIIDGNLRVGKSALAIRAVEQALDYLGKIHTNEIQPDELEEVLGFKPRLVLDSWLQLEERQPVYIWDDAGYWLHSMNWHDPVMISIQQYFNVVGTDYNTVLMTTPSPNWVLAKIANMPEMIRVKCVKRDGGIGDSDSRRFSRKGTAYKRWQSPDMKSGGVNKIWVDEYSCKIRQDLYDWYKPIRDQYAKEAKLAILKSLKNKSNEDRLDELRTMRRLRRLEKELYGESVTPINEELKVEQ